MAIKRRREALVHQHLERVSRNLLKFHSDVVRKFIGRNSGIYALYKKNRLYYVGLASSLSARLKSHMRDRHKKSWDHFAIFLTIRDHHIKEIESLLLRIARPRGNAVTGKPKGSKNILPLIKKAIKLEQDRDREYLFGHHSSSKAAKVLSSERGILAQLFPNGASLRAVYKGETFWARIRQDGKVRFNGETLSSLNLAAKKATGRGKNSWHFWQVERGKGNWVRLREIRKAGTPVLSSKKSALMRKRTSAAKKAWITRGLNRGM